MSKVIFKLKFQSPNKNATKKNNMNHMYYIGTRQGVALNDDMKEIEGKTNKTNNDEYVKYIAQRTNSHGLFSKENMNVDIREATEKMKDYGGYVYRGIVSLRETDAIEKGYDEKEKWEELVRDKMHLISKQLNIPYKDLEWVGAFHRESGHPHVHLMMWNKEPEVRNIGVISKGNIENIRKAFTKEIFENEMEQALSLKNVYRDFLVNTTKDIGNSNSYESNFLDLDDKVKEIDVRFSVKNFEENIRMLEKEKLTVESPKEKEEIEMKIKGFETGINEANVKMKMYEIKDKINSLEIQKDIIDIKRELEFAMEKGNISQYEDYLSYLKKELGIYSLERERKICNNQKEVIKIKSELIQLNDKKRTIEIEEEFNVKGIKIDSVLIEPEKLNDKDVLLIEEYKKLKIETDNILIKNADDIEEKILILENEFEEHKWKLNPLIAKGVVDGERNKPNINSKDVESINSYLDEKIVDHTERIQTTKEKPLESLGGILDKKISNVKIMIASKFESLDKETIEKIADTMNKQINPKKMNLSEIDDEIKRMKVNLFDEVKMDRAINDELNILIDSEVDNFKVDLKMRNEGNSFVKLEKKMNGEKIKNNIFGLQEDLKSKRYNTLDEVENEKITELKNKLMEINNSLSKGEVSENTIDIQNKINSLKNEIEVEKEGEISKKIIEFEKEFILAKNEVAMLDENLNEFCLGDKILHKDIEKISKMIVDLDVPKKGRLQYKLMPQDVKIEINKITDEIIKLQQYRGLFDNYLKSVEDLTRLYTEKPEDIKEAIDNAKEDIYKRIGNNILKSKREIVVENKKPDFSTQGLLSSVAKLLTSKKNQNDKTRIIGGKSKAERKEKAKENKARGLYSEQDLEQ